MDLVTDADESWKKNDGFFEFVPADGLYVDLTQPSLLSQQQLTHIFRRRGFTSLLSTVGTDRESLIRAFVKYIQPLPCRDEQSTSLTNQLTSSQKLSNRHQLKGCKPTDAADHPVLLKSSSSVSKKSKECDLDSLVIIHNPNWPTSGVTIAEKKTPKVKSKINENGKRSAPDSQPPAHRNPPTSASSSSQPPPKRPKINRNFDGLEEMLRKNKLLS